MREAKGHRLAMRLREVILDGTWIAHTNMKDQLQDLHWQVAIDTSRSTNSIADLARHVHYYIRGVKGFLETSNLEVSDKYSFDFEIF